MAQYTRFATYIEPLMKTPKSQAYTMFVLTIVAIIFFGVLAIRPTILTIVSLNKQITDANVIDKKLSDKIQALQQAQQVLDQTANQQPLLDQAIPNTPNISSVLALLDGRATTAGVTLGGVQMHALTLPGEESRVFPATGSATLAAETTVPVGPGGPTGTTGAAPPTAGSTGPGNNNTLSSVDEIDISFTATGNAGQVANFLHQLVLPRRLLVVDSISLAVDKSNNQIANITAKVYKVGAGNGIPMPNQTQQ